jgi:hypothetical protein
MSAMRLVENAKVVALAVPIDTSGAAVASDWVSLKGYSHLTIICVQGAWAGGTPAVTLAQATDVSGTSEKALGFDNYWAGTGLTDDNYAKTAVTSDTYNLAATANTVNIIEIDASSLDVDGGFDCVQFEVASPGANADLIAVIGVLTGTRYPSSDPLTAIAD